jgi:hypothetical protein
MEAARSTDDPWWDTPHTTEEWELERRLEEIFVHEIDIVTQPDWLRDKTLQNWLNYANSMGDKSVVEFTGSDIFSVHSRKYTFKDLKGGDTEPITLKKTEKKRKKIKEKK